MTLTRKNNTKQPIQTIVNLSTRNRTFMLLRNPENIHRYEWFVHIHVFGISFVYFSLTSP